jgi:hypothetical protein
MRAKSDYNFSSGKKWLKVILENNDKNKIKISEPRPLPVVVLLFFEVKKEDGEKKFVIFAAVGLRLRYNHLFTSGICQLGLES